MTPLLPNALSVSALCLALATSPAAACDLAGLDWQRTGDPILRDPIPAENYEGASDAHVFAHDDRVLMVYSGDDGGVISARLAERGPDDGAWSILGTVLGPSQGHDRPRSKETPFYFRAPDGTHQLYVIGYEDEATYAAAVWRATAPAIEGPWAFDPAPVVPLGEIAGRQVEVITSPSVFETETGLGIVFLGWDGFEDVSRVWTFGATSTDNGRTWQDFRQVPVPVGMEGQVTRRPDGGWVAVATQFDEASGSEGIFMACADAPFGPYGQPGTPVLTPAGPPWEVDEIIAPQVFFDGDGAPSLFYTGADYAEGWWIMEVRPSP